MAPGWGKLSRPSCGQHLCLTCEGQQLWNITSDSFYSYDCFMSAALELLLKTNRQRGNDSVTTVANTDQQPRQWPISVSGRNSKMNKIRLSKRSGKTNIICCRLPVVHHCRHVRLGPQTEGPLPHPHWLLQNTGCLYIQFLLILSVLWFQIAPNSTLQVPGSSTIQQMFLVIFIHMTTRVYLIYFYLLNLI